jgi:hypothetical protein
MWLLYVIKLVNNVIISLNAAMGMNSVKGQPHPEKCLNATCLMRGDDQLRKQARPWPLGSLEGIHSVLIHYVYRGNG